MKLIYSTPTAERPLPATSPTQPPAAPASSAQLRGAAGTWPWWAKLIALQKEEGDVGVGDTVARLIPAGESFKTWFKKFTGKDCGCGTRQQNLNTQFPYSNG